MGAGPPRVSAAHPRAGNRLQRRRCGIACLRAFSYAIMGRIALVTGATGFVGGHLAEQLASEGWRVRALVRPTSDTKHLRNLGAELVVGDLRDAEVIRTAADGADVAYHLAAVTFARSEAEFVRGNAEGTRTFARAVSAAATPPPRLVYLSSYAACGPSNGRPRAVSDPAAPLTAYGRTKLAGEAAATGAAARGMEVVVVRAPAVYGPGDRALLPYFRLVKWGIAPLPAGGDRRRLHLIYAPDLGRALVAAGTAAAGTYAVAEPVEHTWTQLVADIGRSMGRRPLRIPLPTAVVRAAAALTQAAGGLAGVAVGFNREKAEEMLAPGWTCELAGSEVLLPEGEATPLAAGLAETVRWYSSQGWI
jgi:dihydroflavonol-4-reductase